MKIGVVANSKLRASGPSAWASIASSGAACYSVAYGNGTYIASNYQDSGGGVLVSTDQGLTFSPVAVSPRHFIGIDFDPTGGGVFCGVCEGAVKKSTDNGASWATSYAVAGDFESIATNKLGTWVAVSYQGGIFYSTDNGSSFSAAATGVSRKWYCVSYDSTIGLFVIVSGEQSFTATSSDGSNWTERAAPVSTLGYVAGGGGQFIAVSTSGHGIYRSVDGINWTSITNSLPNAALNAVGYGGANTFMVVGNDQSGYSSDGGLTWTSIPVARAVTYNGVAKGIASWVAGATDGGNLMRAT